MDTLFKYLRQPTTWAGLISIVTALGLSISPELAAEITSAGIGLVGIIAIVVNEDKD